jgi:hypothetical protein
MSASDNVMLGYAKIDNAGKIVAASLFEKWEKKNLHRERVTPLIGVTKAHALLHLCAKLDISLVPKV